jgi:Mg-chelatase subunit ChlD
MRQAGDKIALVAFGGVPEATVVLPFTTSLSRATRRLRSIPLSGQTPLADGRARILLRQELFKHARGPLVICVTDGEATVPLHRGGNPR